MALLLAKTFEDLGKSGKLIFVDGSPDFAERGLYKCIPKLDEDIDESLQKYIIYRALKLIFPSDTNNRLKKVLEVKGWDEKCRVVNELYDDFQGYSKHYIFKILTAVYNRSKLSGNLNKNLFKKLSSTPMTLVKPTNAVHLSLPNDYNLAVYSPTNTVDIHVIEGNHMTIIDNLELLRIINEAL